MARPWTTTIPDIPHLSAIPSEANPGGSARKGLRQNCLSFWEVVAQSVANIAPVATPALIIPLVYTSSLAGTWLAYLLATVAMLLVTYHINQFARRSSSPGALYTYVSLGLGPTWGVISGWSLVIAYLATGAAVLAGAANYVVVLGHLVLPARFDFLVALAGMLICAAFAWYVAYRDIQLSTQAMLIAEFASVGLIMILAIWFLVKTNRWIDPSQFRLHGVSAGGVRLGLVLAIFSFVGFESATALGDEAKDPLRSIPRSVLFSVLAVGAFFVLMSYVLALAEGPALSGNNEPLGMLANLGGIPGFGTAIAAGAALSEFACGLASINAASRVIFTMGRHGLLHSSMGDAHETHSTPHIAVGISSILAAIVPLYLLFRGIAPLVIFGYVGSVATFGFLFAYILIAVAAPVYLRKRGEKSTLSWIVSVCALVLLFLPLVGSVYPEPPPPGNYLPYVFVALLALGTARFIYLRVSRFAFRVDS
ncbi:MAG: APC family permease [Candidatus Acidiferrales bacterium]